MTWWQQVLSYVLAPAAFAAGLFYLAKKFYEHLLVRAKAEFEQQLKQRWEIRNAVQTAVVNAYQTLEDLLDEHYKLIDDLLMESTQETRGIVRRTGLAKLEMFVDLWVPELDDALSNLRTTLVKASEEYHRILLLMWRLKERERTDEDEIPPGVPAGDIELYRALLEAVKVDTDLQLQKELDAYLPGLVLPSRGDLMHIDAIRRLLRQKALLPLLSQPLAEVDQFRSRLRKASRKFLEDASR